VEFDEEELTKSGAKNFCNEHTKKATLAQMFELRYTFKVPVDVLVELNRVKEGLLDVKTEKNFSMDTSSRAKN
jgi:hypothetical protein